MNYERREGLDMDLVGCASIRPCFDWAQHERIGVYPGYYAKEKYEV